ncbi:MAG: thioredoxin [Thermoleophilia bacterium]
MGSGIIEDLNAESFETTVLGAEGSVVVDFWAPWCGPCKMVGPVLEKLAADHDGTVKVVKVNVDENQDLAARYGIMSIPTVMLFEGGAVKQQLIGARSQKDYEREFGIA